MKSQKNKLCNSNKNQSNKSSFISFHTDSNLMTNTKLTDYELHQFKENYANMIVDGMDMNSLITFAVETIIHNMETWDEEDLKEEILDLYDQETLDNLQPIVEAK